MGMIVPVLTLVFLLFAKVSHGASNPRVILVGGSVGSWKVPDSLNNTLNHWAENNRFKVGDFLGTIYICLALHFWYIICFWFPSDPNVFITKNIYAWLMVLIFDIYLCMWNSVEVRHESRFGTTSDKRRLREL